MKGRELLLPQPLLCGSLLSCCELVADIARVGEEDDAICGGSWIGLPEASQTARRVFSPDR